MVDTFLNNLKFEKRYSSHTITAYQTDLLQFQQFIASTYELTDLKFVAPRHVRSYLAHLIDSGITTRSVQRKLISLRSLYKFLLQENIVTDNPLQRIKLPKAGSRLPVFIEEKDMQKLELTDEISSDFHTLRDQLIVQMLYQTGMRLSELKNLQTNNLNLSKLELKVLGKRNKERIIPFTNDLKVLIENYLAAKKDLPKADKTLVFTLDNGKPLYEKFIYRVVTASLSNISNSEKKSPHILRHTYATHLMNHGANISAIKELLGHSSLASTQIYTHNSIEQLKKAHKNNHPRS